jgi:hypothetical protein
LSSSMMELLASCWISTSSVRNLCQTENLRVQKSTSHISMRNRVHRNHTTLQLEFKNHSNIIVLQLGPPKCNSYATTFYKFNDLINKIPHQKIS